MNHIQITHDKIQPGLAEVELILTRQAEKDFSQKVFPWLFDGRTTGSCSVESDGRVRYMLLVYDMTLVQALKERLFNAILADNGQMN